MYDIYYNVLKENYGKDVNLVSFLLDFRNVDVYKEMKSGILKEHMNLFNFPIDHSLYSEDNKGKLGLLKPETSDNHISEVVCLAPKCYNVLLEDETVKNSAKGVNRTQKANFRHETYRDLHDGIVKEVRAPCSVIKSISNKLLTIKAVKKHFQKWIVNFFG